MTSRTIRGSTAATPGNLIELGHDRERRPFERDETCGNRALGVEAVAPGSQRIIGRYRGDEYRDAGGDHQRNRHDLPAHGEDIPQKFAIQQAHQRTSSGESRRALRSSPTMRPPPSRSTRSAMPAIAALWVMITVVVPSSHIDPRDRGQDDLAGLVIERAGRLVAQQHIGAI